LSKLNTIGVGSRVKVFVATAGSVQIPIKSEPQSAFQPATPAADSVEELRPATPAETPSVAPVPAAPEPVAPVEDEGGVAIAPQQNTVFD
jgi:hypothetical protein